MTDFKTIQFKTIQFKTIQTQLLEIGYLEQGPADGKPIILLHGWPYDAHIWDAVTGPLAEQGWHTYAPSLRGFGPDPLFG